jgi:hypothetical protein
MVEVGVDCAASAHRWWPWSPPVKWCCRGGSARPRRVVAPLRRARARAGRGGVRATSGWRWFVDLLADAGIAAHLATRWPPRRSRPPGSPTTRGCQALAQLLGPTCWPRPGSPHRRPGRPAGWSAPAPAWSDALPGQSQLHALLADLGIIPELTTRFGPAGRRWTPACGCSTPSPSRSTTPTPTCGHASPTITECGGGCRSPGW